jgi:3-hydroxypropanoate dehydrogenase
MRGTLNSDSLDLMFRAARTANGFTPEKIAEAVIREMYDLMKLAPTSANCSPARFLFLTSKEAKEKLMPAVSSGNSQKTLEAPVTVIVGYDTQFYEFLPELFPHAPDAKNWFTSSPDFARDTAFRNGTLQGAYLIMAARALGFDAGPMSGFDQAKVDAAFWPDGRIKSNFLCNIGHGDDSKVFPRNPRPDFDKVCRIL